MNTTTNQSDVLDKVTASIEGLAARCGARIEFTLRGADAFTISGAPADVDRVRPLFAGYKVTGEQADEELGEVFVYYAM